MIWICPFFFFTQPSYSTGCTWYYSKLVYGITTFTIQYWLTRQVSYRLATVGSMIIMLLWCCVVVWRMSELLLIDCLQQHFFKMIWLWCSLLEFWMKFIFINLFIYLNTTCLMMINDEALNGLCSCLWCGRSVVWILVVTGKFFLFTVQWIIS